MSFGKFKRKLLRRLGVIPPKYKSYVGPADKFELIGKAQFEHLRHWGLAANHYLLDIGCGSLRGGRFAIGILEPEHYYGVEPNQWLIDDGIKYELGAALLQLKRPVFSNDAEFNLGVFGREFDFLMAQSIFSHTSQAQMRKIFIEAAKVMHEKSIFLATYLAGKTDYMGTEWRYPEGVQFTFERVRAFAAEARLECAPVNWFHPTQRWLVFYHSSNSDFADQRRRAAEDRDSANPTAAHIELAGRIWTAG
jgi:hypothetical protein